LLNESITAPENPNNRPKISNVVGISQRINAVRIVAHTD